MKKCTNDYLIMKNNIYLVTDPRPNLLEIIEECCKNNIYAVQLRDKKCSDLEFIKQANKISFICKKYGTKFFINDRAHLLKEIQCDGIHVGQKDENIKYIKIEFPNLEIGVSCQNLMQVKRAIKYNADYLGVGALYPTRTKKDAKIVSLKQLENMKVFKEKIIIIGGINSDNLKNIPNDHYKYVAISSFLLDSKNIKETIIKLINKH